MNKTKIIIAVLLLLLPCIYFHEIILHPTEIFYDKHSDVISVFSMFKWFEINFNNFTFLDFVFGLTAILLISYLVFIHLLVKGVLKEEFNKEIYWTKFGLYCLIIYLLHILVVIL